MYAHFLPGPNGPLPLVNTFELLRLNDLKFLIPTAWGLKNNIKNQYEYRLSYENDSSDSMEDINYQQSSIIISDDSITCYGYSNSDVYSGSFRLKVF